MLYILDQSMDFISLNYRASMYTYNTTYHTINSLTILVSHCFFHFIHEHNLILYVRREPVLQVLFEVANTSHLHW